MVSEKRRAYMKEYMRRKRAKEKLLTVSTPPQYTVEKPEIVVDQIAREYGLTVAPIDTSVCLHCRSKEINREGNIVKCRRCGITYDLSKGFVQRVCAENEI